MPRAGRSASKAGTKARVIIRTPFPRAPVEPKPSAIFDAVRDELIRVDRKTGRLELLQPKPDGRLSLELATDRVVGASRASKPSRRSRATRAKRRSR